MGKDAEGTAQQTWTDYCQLFGWLVPQTDMIKAEKTGFFESVDYAFATKRVSADIKVGNRVLFGDIPLYITRADTMGGKTVMSLSKNVK